MAVQNIKNNLAYGFNNPLQHLSPEPIIALRDPQSTDVAEIGTLWVNSASNAYFVLTSKNTWTAQSSGSTSVASLEVTGGSGTVLTVDAGGDTSLGGDLAVTGDTTMTGGLTVDGALVANGGFDITSSSAIEFISTANVDPSILLQTNGGTSETIEIFALQGTASDSVSV